MTILVSITILMTSGTNPTAVDAQQHKEHHEKNKVGGENVQIHHKVVDGEHLEATLVEPVVGLIVARFVEVMSHGTAPLCLVS